MSDHTDVRPETPHARHFSGPNLLQIAMPLGGIGAGCLCLNGSGGLQDFAFRQKPSTTAIADGWDFQQAAFALLHVKGNAATPSITRLVEGPLPVEKIYDQSLQAQGYRKGGHEGLPRFAENDFLAEYPFGHVRLTDPRVPLAATVTGWSPFVPLDDRVSSMPVAILEYTLENRSSEAVDFELSFHVSHPAVGARGWKDTRTSLFDFGIDGGRGVAFTSTDPTHTETHGSAALALLSHSPTAIKTSWLRGGWFDGLSALWREVSTGCFADQREGGHLSRDGRNGGSILIAGQLAPGESVVYSFALAWHFPNSNQTYGGVTPASPPANDPDTPPLWRPYYAGQWPHAEAVLRDLAVHFDSLRARTRAFANALYGSTLPPVVLDAVGSNLAILKSPTVLRQENGNLWAWEGCFTDRGSCHGTCTHVWNYAQAFPHLFPALERTLREQEFCRSMDAEGHVNFRATLPDGPTPHSFHAAADGQLGGILKLYRDWSISGDTDWLTRLYPLAKRSLEYGIHQWDSEERGALFEPHHNTYDIEFWGADPMCTTIYIAALSAMALLARAVNHAETREDTDRYQSLAERGARYLEKQLHNGEYLVQRVQWEDLRNTTFADYLAAGAQPDDDAYPLLLAEGPRYQYGDGCLSDGVIGAWMATLYGVPTPMRPETIRDHLRAIYRYNFRADLSEHACTQRPGYAIGNELGLLLCTWPRGNKPTLPFVYSDEVWTGIEYQVASHLILEGMVEEGLAIVAAVRSRYEGHVRNPFNEYECGSYYARALASFALLPALSGFRYHAPSGLLELDPKVLERPFRTFFSTDAAWGVAMLTDAALTIEVIEGALPIRALRIRGAANSPDTYDLAATVTVRSGEIKVFALPLPII